MKPPKPKRREHLEIEHWEAHLYHMICGRWADQRCRVCSLKNSTRQVVPQWEVPPGARNAIFRLRSAV
jgi:hypothetical protein